MEESGAPPGLGSLADLLAPTGAPAPAGAAGSAVRFSVEDPDGRPLAGADPRSGLPLDARDARDEPWVSRPIEIDGRVVGRLTAHGPEAGRPAVVAATEILARALSVVLIERRARDLAEAAATSIGAEAAAERHRRIDDELALGRRLQRSFLTLEAPDAPGYDLASHYEQAHEVGGDFFDLFRLLRRGRPLSVVVADVTGKGVAAALLMAFARPLIHAAIDHAAGPADALERTNRVLRERRAWLFITALCGSLTLSTGRLRLANAGHEPPLLVRHDGSPIRAIEGGGPLLGAFPSLGIVESITELAPGDVVVLYTDGVTDARSVGGERFEEGRLHAAIEAARGGSAFDLVDSIRGSVDTFQAGALAADDVTIVAIGRQPRRRRSVRGVPADS